MEHVGATGAGYSECSIDASPRPVAKPVEWQAAIELRLQSLDDEEPLPRSPSKAWRRLDLRIHAWADLSRVAPRITRNRGLSPRVTFGGLSLFGALSLQLMLTVVRVDGLAVCSACGGGGDAFVPERRPRPGRSYCDACRKSGKAIRDASADHRRRELVKQLFRDGASLREVALRTGLEEEKLRTLRVRSRGKRRRGRR